MFQYGRLPMPLQRCDLGICSSFLPVRSLSLSNRWVGRIKMKKLIVLFALLYMGSARAEVPTDVTAYLTFSGFSQFSLTTDNASKNWDGKLYYSTDAVSWTEWTGTEVYSSPSGKLYLCGVGNTKISGSSSTTYRFKLTGNSISCSGNIETLLDYKTVENGNHPSMDKYAFAYLFANNTTLIAAPALPATTLAGFCYALMFSDCTSLTTAPELPATTLANACYNAMFSGCTSLTTAPALPAMTLAGACYNAMFSDCTSLTTAPALPATTLVAHCYSSMFFGCTSLTTVPALPATTLAFRCYSSMFACCTSLTTAPALPATTLDDRCYSFMFSCCTSLTTAPALPATTLADECYASMFSYCTSLRTAPELPATTLADSCYEEMFEGCTSLTVPPALPAENLADGCYRGMFSDCSGIQLYQTRPAVGYFAEWKIPATAIVATDWNVDMFVGTAGDDLTTPSIGVTYYFATSTHTHLWSSDWSYNETHHWHECAAALCPIDENSRKNEYAAHTDISLIDGKCDVCGYQITVLPYTLTVNTAKIGSMTVGEPQNSAADGTITIEKSIASAGETFMGWFVDGELKTGDSLTLTLTEDKTINEVWLPAALATGIENKAIEDAVQKELALGNVAICIEDEKTTGKSVITFGLEVKEAPELKGEATEWTTLTNVEAKIEVDLGSKGFYKFTVPQPSVEEGGANN